MTAIEEKTRIKIADVERLTGVHRQTIWRWYSTAGGTFPRPHYLGRDRFWMRSEVLAWIEQQTNAA